MTKKLYSSCSSYSSISYISISILVSYDSSSTTVIVTIWILVTVKLFLYLLSTVYNKNHSVRYSNEASCLNKNCSQDDD